MMMIDSDSFFIPKRIKIQKSVEETTNSDEHNKQPKRYYKNGVLIFDEEEENKQKKKEDEIRYQQRVDIEFQDAENKEAFEMKRTNAMVASFWACHIYLEPAIVRHLTVYWLSQYVNYKLPESQWFNDHITRLMINPVRLEFTSSQGIAYVHSNQSKYALLMQVAGSPLHRIPSEYFSHSNVDEMFECLCHLLEFNNQCFLVRNTFGLKGELECAAFQYNRILSYFYEPSFLIIDSYLFWIHELLTMPLYRNTTHFLTQIKNIMKPIHPDNIPWQRLFSLNAENTNYEEKRRVFIEDLSDLYKALDHPDIETVKNELTFLWSKKASYVTDQIPIRQNAIKAQLYPEDYQ